MIYIILLVIVVPIIYLLIKMFQSSTPRGFAKELAKAQLLPLKVVRQKFPEKNKEEQYFLALKTRPKYTDDEVKRIIEGAKRVCKEIKMPFNFRSVVIYLVVHEYTKRMGNPPEISMSSELEKAVTSVINNEL